MKRALIVRHTPFEGAAGFRSSAGCATAEPQSNPRTATATSDVRPIIANPLDLRPSYPAL